MSNWFTTERVRNDVEFRIKKAATTEDLCKHVSEQPETLYVISRENDSFGVVGEYGMCQACYRKSREERDNENSGMYQ